MDQFQSSRQPIPEARVHKLATLDLWHYSRNRLIAHCSRTVLNISFCNLCASYISIPFALREFSKCLTTLIVTEVMLVLLAFLSSSLKITAIYEATPFMLRRSEPTFQWDLLPTLLRIYSTTLIDTTAGPSETQMKFGRTSCCHRREHTHTYTQTHTYIYTNTHIQNTRIHTHIYIYIMYINIYIYLYTFSPISLLYLMFNLISHLPLPLVFISTTHTLLLISLYCLALLLLSLSLSLSLSLCLSVSLVFCFMVVHCSLAYFLVS